MTWRELGITGAALVIGVGGAFGVAREINRRTVQYRYSVTCLGPAGDTLFASDSVWRATQHLFNNGWLFKDVTAGTFQVTGDCVVTRTQ